MSRYTGRKKRPGIGWVLLPLVVILLCAAILTTTAYGGGL